MTLRAASLSLFFIALFMPPYEVMAGGLEDCPYGYRNDHWILNSAFTSYGNDSSCGGWANPEGAVGTCEAYGVSHTGETIFRPHYVLDYDCANIPSDDTGDDGCFPENMASDGYCEGQEKKECKFSDGSTFLVSANKSCDNYCPGGSIAETGSVKGTVHSCSDEPQSLSDEKCGGLISGGWWNECGPAPDDPHNCMTLTSWSNGNSGVGWSETVCRSGSDSDSGTGGGETGGGETGGGETGGGETGGGETGGGETGGGETDGGETGGGETGGEGTQPDGSTCPTDQGYTWIPPVEDGGIGQCIPPTGGGETGGGEPGGGETGGGEAGGGETGGDTGGDGGGATDPTDPGTGGGGDGNDLTGNLPGKVATKGKSFGEIGATFRNKISQTPIVSMGEDIVDIFDIGSVSCPPLSIDLPRPINQTVSTRVHCTVLDSIKSILSAVMLIVYIVMGFRIVFSA